MCESAPDVDEATAGLETGPTQYCLPSRFTEILMNLVILKLHVIRQVGKHRQLHLRVPGVSSAGEERIFHIRWDTGVRVSLVRRGLLTSGSPRRSAATVTLRVANGEIMEGRLDEAQISLEFVRHGQLSRPDLVTNTRSRGCSTRWNCRCGT